MSEISPIKISRSAFGITHLKNKIYCLGGAQSNNHYLSDCEVYDIKSNTWASNEIPDLPVAKISCTAITFENRYIFVIGGDLP
jgi:hypothetical protein